MKAQEPGRQHRGGCAPPADAGGLLVFPARKFLPADAAGSSPNLQRCARAKAVSQNKGCQGGAAAESMRTRHAKTMSLWCKGRVGGLEVAGH